MKLRDRIWLWGQDTGVHHLRSHGNPYNLPGENNMESHEGCDYFGINKCCRVAMDTGPFPPFDEEAEKLKELEVVWSAVGAGGLKQHNDDQSDLDEVLRMADLYPNITGAVLDDFFSSVEFAEQKAARHSVESITSMRDRLHGFAKRKLDLWLVWYSYQLNYDIQDYLDLCDVITLWTWKGSELANLEQSIDTMLERTPGKRHFAGYYMWNYGEKKPFTIDDMKFQSDIYVNRIKSGELDGIILCSNCIADIGLDTVEWTRNWLAEIGDEEI